MHDSLDNLRAALAAMSDTELTSLEEATDAFPQFAPGLLAYLAHACDWEHARRSGRSFPLNGPHAAVPPEEMDLTSTTLALMMARFDTHPRTADLFRAVGDALALEPPQVH